KLIAAREALQPRLGSVLSAFLRDGIAEDAAALAAQGVPPALAERLAYLPVALLVPDIMLAAEMGQADLAKAADAFFTVSEIFRLSRIEAAAGQIAPSDYYDGLALTQAMEIGRASCRERGWGWEVGES